MLSNYLKAAWRQLRKNRVFSFINIFGLTIGVTACLMIFLFLLNEFSMDRFHENSDRIYRVIRGYERDGEPGRVAYLSGLYADALQTDFPGEIEKTVRVMRMDNLVSINEKSFHESKVFAVDSSFFQVFSFPLLKGNKADLLKNPGSVVITASTAKKYFGSVDNAMGQTIQLDHELLLTVTGILKDISTASHLEFDLLVPLANYRDIPVMKKWINNGVYTYVMLRPNANVSALESRFPAFIDKYLGSELKQFGFHWTLSLLPLKDVYFDKTDYDKHGDKKVVYIFLSVAVLILLIACINFTNLSTIRAVDRSKEVGLRKVLGALRSNLIGQFIGESVLLTAIACGLAVGLLKLLMPLYTQWLGYPVSIIEQAIPMSLFLISVIVLIGLLAGSYPAFFLSAFSPIQALKGKLKLGKAGAGLRQLLVVIQFSISIFLIVAVIVSSKQMDFVKNKEVGYDKEQTLIVRLDNREIGEHREAFKTMLLENNGIKNVSFMSGEPGGFFDAYVFKVDDRATAWNARTEFADFDFVKTLGLKIIAGRDLSGNFPTDTTNAVLINETAAKSLGWAPQEAVGHRLLNTVRDEAPRTIVGVVNDFNYESLKENIASLVIAPNPDRRVALVRLSSTNINASVDAVNSVYRKIAPSYPFEYKFLDQQFDRIYKTDIRQQTLLSVFGILAIIVACLGLFGLASFATTKRFKEIGVRKVLGSSVSGIVILLSKDLLKPVLIAACVSIPIGYLVMSKWLQNFAYQTSLSSWIFIAAAFFTLVIAWMTIGIKAIGAALMNPVKSLRTE